MMPRQVDLVEMVIEYALAQPPSRAGRRLRSERDLEHVLGAGRRQINAALSRLAQRGLVSRQRGAGTFVRKVMPLSSQRSDDLRQLWSRCPIESPDQIFADVDPSTDPNLPQRKRQRLHLALWCDWVDGKRHRQITIAEMIRCVQEAGHTLTVHSIVEDDKTPMAPTELSRQLAASPCDGYLVVSRWADAFLAAIPEPKAPIIFCGGLGWSDQYQPAVTSDAVNTIAAAVRRLAEQEFERIGMIGLYETPVQIPPQQRVYERAMDDAGLSYRASTFADAQTLPVGRRLRELFDRADTPEAIYVADDHLLPGFCDAISVMALEPGVDMGVIVLANHNVTPVPDPSWSRYVFDPRAVGRLAVQNLLDLIESGNPLNYNLVVQAIWHAGTTHLRTPKPTGRAKASAI